jgi:hypothetical protein
MEHSNKPVSNEVMNAHLYECAGQLTGSEKFQHLPNTQIAVPTGTKKRFQSGAPHAMCGCFSCFELAKIFSIEDEETKNLLVNSARAYAEKNPESDF